MPASNHNALRVARLDLWVNPVFDQVITANAGLALCVLSREAGRPDTWAALSQAHAYHVSPAKDELPSCWWVNNALLARCPDLLCVSAGGAGYDTVDVDACTRAGVAVVNQAGANAASVAEMTFALLLALVKRLNASDAMLRSGTAVSREALMGNEIEGRVFGLVGIGAIGLRAARIAAGFGMRPIAYDPLLSNDEIRARGAEPVSFADLLRQADVVSLHCPLDTSTRGMMNAQAYAAMKPGALFLTTARGGIHDETALQRALESGHLGGAGLDVWQVEPPPSAHPLLQRDDVVATFHTAGVTHEGRRKVAQGSASQIVTMLSGERPAQLLNPAVWPRFQERLAQAKRIELV